MSCERALNFDQWKTFSENHKPMRVWLWLVHKFTENYIVPHDISQTQKRYPTSLSKMYPNLKTTYISNYIFLWTKLLENLLLAKYLISVAAPVSVQNEFCIYFPIINSKGVHSKTVSPPTPNPPLLTLLSLKTLKSAV